MDWGHSRISRYTGRFPWAERTTDLLQPHPALQDKDAGMRTGAGAA